MKHTKALIIKLLMAGVIFFPVLTLGFQIPWTYTIGVSLVFTTMAYLLGDILIFRNLGDRSDPMWRGTDQPARNMAATVADGVLAFLLVGLMGVILINGETNMLAAAFISASLISGGEWFFHKYLDSVTFSAS